MDDDIWLIEAPGDDLNTMEDNESQLDCDGISDWEDGLIRGFKASA